MPEIQTLRQLKQKARLELNEKEELLPEILGKFRNLIQGITKYLINILRSCRDYYRVICSHSQQNIIKWNGK